MADPKHSCGDDREGGGERRPDGSFTDPGFVSSEPVSGPAGLANSLQPGGTLPGGGPGASEGSLGTGGGQTGDRDSGSLKRDGR